MPSPESRAVFDDAHRIAAQMRDIHAQEKDLVAMKDRMTDQAAIAELDRELTHLRHDWAHLASQYTEAVGRFSRAADEARRKQDGVGAGQRPTP